MVAPSISLRRYAHVLCVLALACSLRAVAQPTALPEKTGRLAGELVDEVSGKPVPGVPISVRGTTMVTTAGADGTFRFLQVIPGTYQIVVAGDLYEPVRLSDVTVRAGRTTSLQITLRRRTVMTSDLITAAGRKIQTADEVPASTYVVPRSAIANRNAYDVEEILNYVPGVQVSGGLVDIRGTGGTSVGGGSQVAVLIDGLPATTPGNERLPVGLIPTSAIQRVELIKGAASALYGSGAEGGVVNIVTRQPSEHPGVDLRAYTGFYTNPERQDWIWWGSKIQRFTGAQGTWLRTSGPIGLLLAGGFNNDEGYRQFDDRKDYNLFGKINGTLNAQTEIRASVALAGTNHGDFDTWRGYDSALYASRRDTLSYRTFGSYARINGEIRSFVWQNFSVLLRGGLFTANAQVKQDSSIGTARETRSNSVFGEIFFNSTLNPMVQFKYGGLVQFDLRNVVGNGLQWRRITSAYGQMEFTNNEDITASIGGRLDIVLNPRSEIAQELQFSPRVGVNYRPMDGTTLRVLMGRGFRAASLQERYNYDQFGSVQFKPNRKLGSEQNWHGEVGGTQRLDLFGVDMTGDLSLYVDEYFNLIQPMIDPADGKAMFTSDTRARILGSDLLLKGRLPWLSLSFTAGVTSISATNLRTSEPLQGRPSLIGHGSLFWESSAMTIGLDYRYASRVSNVDPVLETAVYDVDVRSQAHTFDLRMSLNMAPLVRLPVIASINARNLFQYYAFNALGSVSPIRNLEASIQASF